MRVIDRNQYDYLDYFEAGKAIKLPMGRWDILYRVRSLGLGPAWELPLDASYRNPGYSAFHVPFRLSLPDVSSFSPLFLLRVAFSFLFLFSSFLSTSSRGLWSASKVGRSRQLIVRPGVS